MSDSKSSRGVSFFTSLGASLAVVISYVKWHSIGWAIIHGICGWGYVAYAIYKQW